MANTNPRNTTTPGPGPLVGGAQQPPPAGGEGGIPPEAEQEQGGADQGVAQQPLAPPQQRGNGRRPPPVVRGDDEELPAQQLDPHAHAPKAPPGYAVLYNGSEDTVTVELRDGDNQPRRTKVKAGRYEVFPLAYVKVAISRAPQLVEINRTAAEPDGDDD